MPDVAYEEVGMDEEDVVGEDGPMPIQKLEVPIKCPYSEHRNLAYLHLM